MTQREEIAEMVLPPTPADYLTNAQLKTADKILAKMREVVEGAEQPDLDKWVDLLWDILRARDDNFIVSAEAVLLIDWVEYEITNAIKQAILKAMED